MKKDEMFDENNYGEERPKSPLLKIAILIIIILLLLIGCQAYKNKTGTYNPFKKPVSSDVGKDPVDDRTEIVDEDLKFVDENGDIYKNSTVEVDKDFVLNFKYDKNNKNLKFTCESSDPDVATCSVENGKVIVHPHSPGKAVIKVTVTDGDKTYVATHTVVIKDVTVGISLNKNIGTIYLRENDTIEFTYKLKGCSGTLVASVDNPSLAEVTIEGDKIIVKGLAEGEAKITVSVDSNGKTYKREITVTIKEDKDSIINEDIKFVDQNGNEDKESENPVDKDFELKVDIEDNNLKKYTMTCESSDPKVATCSIENKKVVVHPHSPGKTVIKVIIDDGKKKHIATHVVVIKDVDVGISLTNNTGTIYLRDFDTIEFGYTLKNCSGKLEYYLSNPSLAQVTITNDTIVVKGLSAGETKVVVSVNDNGIIHSREITVKIIDETPPEDYVPVNPSYTWDVHFSNIKVTPGSVNPIIPAVIKSGTALNYEIYLENLGDYYEFTVDVENTGTLDARLDSLVTSKLRPDQLKYFEYRVTYSNGAPIKEGDILASGRRRTIRVLAQYKPRPDGLPERDEAIPLAVILNYSQVR